MRCDFSKGNWSMEGLAYAYSCRFSQNTQFVQREDCIENPRDPAMRDGYSYITLLTEQKVRPGIRLTTHCSFRGMAAPLVVIVKDLFEKDGVASYGDYQEVVLWKNGIYAESGMGCTGPIVLMSPANKDKARELLQAAGYIG